MGKRHARYCGRCRTTHTGLCPLREEYLQKKWRDRPEKKSGRGGARWRELRKKVFERDGYKCQICKSRGVLTVVTLHGSLHGVCDHIVPLAWGGTDAMSNLQTICQACDAEKSKQESIKGRVGSKP